MNKQLEALIARAKHIVENGGLLARDTPLQLIAALEQAQRSNAFLKEQLAQLANFNPDWDKLEACQRSWREVGAELKAVEKRIAELEASETQLICERDNAEEALADMYQAATGERPEWSNFFSFSDAVDAVEQRLGELEASPLAVKLPDRIVDIHLRSPREVEDMWIARFTQALNVADRLQDSAYRNGVQQGFSYGQTNDQAGYEQTMRAYSNTRAAGGTVEGE